jgi:hypothetical protein
MMVVDGQVLALGVTLASALPAELRLAKPNLEIIKMPSNGFNPRAPKMSNQRVVANRSYGVDSLRNCLKQSGIKLITLIVKVEKNQNAGWSKA